MLPAQNSGEIRGDELTAAFLLFERACDEERAAQNVIRNRDSSVVSGGDPDGFPFTRRR